MRLVLASTSPRRIEILKSMGLEFEIASPLFEEIESNLSPSEIVKHNALGKARAVAKEYQDAIVIACDTVISLNGLILGKPNDEFTARETLKILSGSKNQVYSGLAIINTLKREERFDIAITDVYFKKLTDEEIQEYIKTGEPLDKAGAYGIQGLGGKFVEKIEGSFTNVVGLPKELLSKMLNELGSCKSIKKRNICHSCETCPCYCE